MSDTFICEINSNGIKCRKKESKVQSRLIVLLTLQKLRDKVDYNTVNDIFKQSDCSDDYSRAVIEQSLTFNSNELENSNDCFNRAINFLQRAKKSRSFLRCWSNV